jgi:hypothetical protein
MRKMVDPPSGWRYGFPKMLPENFDQHKIREWLVENGYPQEEIDSLGDYFYVRFWMEPKHDGQ